MRLLLVCGLAVLATAELARKAHFLNTVLGSKHTAQLGLTIDDLDSMVNDEHGELEDSLQRTYLACSTLAASADAGKAIVDRVGEDNKHTVYSSRVRNVACWAVRATAAQADALAEDGLMQSVVVIPREAKIHFNVLDFFEHELHGVTPSGEGWKRTPASFEGAVLKVEFGLGTSKGMSGIDMAAAVDGWRTKLHGSGSGDVRSSSTSTRRGRWGAVHQLAGRSTSLRCDFSGLDVQLTTYTAHIRGLTSLSASAHGLGCLSRFVELAVSDHRVIRVLIAPEYKALNIYARGITQTGTPGDESYGLTGTGQVVGVADTGVDDLSCFFVDTSGTITPRSTAKNPKTYPTRRKVIQYVAYADAQDEEGGHGSHVCGSVLGQSTGDNTDYNGMAQGAKLAFFDIGDTESSALSVPSLYDSVFPAAKSAGAHIHSNSWGSSYQACDQSCYDVDRYTYENPDFLVLFAASNDGMNGYFSIGNPAMSKNCVAVGAAQEARDENPTFSNDNMAYFSSIGPTFDNRIKPDVAAPGSYIYSAHSSGTTTDQTCDILKMRGTSMATPVTAGNAALIRQYFEDAAFWSANCNAAYGTICDAFSPTGTLVKALLINSGEAMAKYDDEGQKTALPSQALSAPPDYFQGYGRVKLDNTLPMAGVADFDLYVLDGYNVNSEDTIELELTITDTSKPIRITMSWYDPPTTAYTSKQVLHDLDLLVVAPGGATSWGNGIEFGDENNNNEKVYIESPVAGTYKVYVHAYTLTESAAQSISLVISSGGSVVSGPTTGAAWSYDLDDRACAESELSMNLIDLGVGAAYSTWGLGNFLQIFDQGTDEVVFLGMSAKAVTTTSACLSGTEYSAQLTLAELAGTEDQATAAKEVFAEIQSCAFLLFKNFPVYDFTMNNGECDYCQGQYQFTVQWANLNANPQRALWLLHATDGAGNAIGERYGGTGLSGPTTICLDEGIYALQVLKPVGSGAATVSIPACGASLNVAGAYSCLNVDHAGVCTVDDDCIIDFVDEDDDDSGKSDDDDDSDDDKIAGLSVGAFAGVMAAVVVVALVLGTFLYRRQRAPQEATHTLMQD